MSELCAVCPSFFTLPFGAIGGTFSFIVALLDIFAMFLDAQPLLLVLYSISCTSLFNKGPNQKAVLCDLHLLGFFT